MMGIRKIQFYLTYAFIFSCVFFVGFDNTSLFLKTFHSYAEISIDGLLPFFAVSLGGILIGLLIYRRVIKRQPLPYILKLSLLMAAFLSWLQYYLPNILEFSSLYIQTITVFLTNISMGVFLYCAKTILAEKNKTSKNATTTLLWIFFIFGMLAIAVKQGVHLLDGTSLISSVCYILGFLSFMFLKGNDFMEIKHSSPYANLGILAGMSFLFIVYFLAQTPGLNYLNLVGNHQAFSIIFASLFFHLKPSVNKASLALFLILSQFFK